MKVKDVMTKNVVKVKLSTGIRQIYNIFCEKHIGGVPVVDGEDRLIGMVTKTELLDVLIPDYFGMLSDFLFIDDFGALEEKLESIPPLELFIAEDLMIRNAISINEDASLMKAPVLMSNHNVRRLPVVTKDNKLIGIITRMDVCNALFNGRRAPHL
ncbi:MAG: CBS domain-containing protein [Candidatus Omnitrophica bacterium]|nr:CBS domain-containing protein [Candidatus Omnitrophota bacterium]